MPKGKKPGKFKASWTILFWLGFAIIILGLYLFNRESIRNSISTIQNEIASRNNHLPEPLPPLKPDENILFPQTPEITQPVSPPQNNLPVQNGQAENSREEAEEPAPGQKGESPQPVLRNRAIYFTQVDRSGSILRVKVERQLPLSDSPMIDVLRALISGPNNAEKQKGLITLIPSNTKILSATVRGDTAYISFSEDFQYNTYGVEGYAGQVREIVFTATEFQNVKYVQILIEGRRIDYLGEGIWIGGPLNRDML